MKNIKSVRFCEVIKNNILVDDMMILVDVESNEDKINIKEVNDSLEITFNDVDAKYKNKSFQYYLNTKKPLLLKFSEEVLKNNDTEWVVIDLKTTYQTFLHVKLKPLNT